MTDPRHAIIAEAISASRETLRGCLIDERLFSAMADQIIAALDAARPAITTIDDDPGPISQETFKQFTTARPVEPPADEEVAGLVERLKAEDARMLRLWDHVIVLRDKHHGSDAASDLNGVKHAIAGRDPVLTEAAALIERLSAEVARLTADLFDAEQAASVEASARREFNKRATAAEAEVADLRARLAKAGEALRAHNDWHQQIGTVIFPAEEGQTEPTEIDLSTEYADSALCEQTCAALDAIKDDRT